MKRGRNQRRRQGGGQNPNRALDSNGPDVRIRGTANQIYDKYIALARDASSAGDRIKAENYLQHAEHYFRLIRAMQPQQQTPSVDADGDQPSVDDKNERGGGGRQSDRGERSDRRPRGNGEDAGRKDAESADESQERTPDAAASDDGDERTEKPKRKRARRAPRKSAAKDDDSDADSPEPAAAS
ncbi:MAG: DUF4167 domain-containing protein [Pseudomonadota bacterium]